MAEQKKTNEALNVEDALTQSEAFLIKNKKTIIGAILAIIIIIAGIVMYKNLYAVPREEKAQAALFKGQEYFEADAFAENGLTDLAFYNKTAVNRLFGYDFPRIILVEGQDNRLRICQVESRVRT